MLSKIDQPCAGITAELFHRLLLRNANPALAGKPEAKLIGWVIAQALADADKAHPTPEREIARDYLRGSARMRYHAGMVGLNPAFVSEQVARIREWL